VDIIEKLVPVVITLLTAAIGAAGVLVQEWRQKRDDNHQRKRARAEASEMVSLIEKWIQTQQLACSEEEFAQVKQTARQQLEHVYSSMLTMQEVKEPVEERSFIQRALLLYRPVSFGAWVLHLMFYGLGAMILLLGFFTALLIIAPNTNQNSDNNLTPGGWVVMLSILYLLLFLPALGIRAWAIVIDKRHRKHQAAVASVSIAALSSHSLPAMLASLDEVECLIPMAPHVRRGAFGRGHVKS
jgi:hypothetical protein